MSAAPDAADRGTAVSRGLLALLFVIAAAFAGLGFYRGAGMPDDVTVADSTGDDWLMYKGMALSILDGGWTIPAVHGDYYRPAGFLYNYFVAAVFAATGRDSVNVYIVQAVLLGLSVVMTTLAFRRYLLTSTQYMLAGLLAVTAYLDVFRNYTFRLLSENLLVFLIPCFWLLLLASLRRRGMWLAFWTGIVIGLCGLTRPNLLPFGPILAVALWLLPGGFNGRQIATFLLGYCASLSLLVVRNYAVTGRVSLLIVTGGMIGYRLFSNQPVGATAAPVVGAAEAIGVVIWICLKRVLYSFGFLFLIRPEYRLRPHWVLAWIGVALFILLRRFSLETWEWLVLLFIAGYLGPLYAVGGIESYGYRMILPVIPAVMLLAVRSIDLALKRRLGVAAPVSASS